MTDLDLRSLERDARHDPRARLAWWAAAERADRWDAVREDLVRAVRDDRLEEAAPVLARCRAALGEHPLRIGDWVEVTREGALVRGARGRFVARDRVHRGPPVPCGCERVPPLLRDLPQRPDPECERCRGLGERLRVTEYLVVKVRTLRYPSGSTSLRFRPDSLRLAVEPRGDLELFSLAAADLAVEPARVEAMDDAQRDEIAERVERVPPTAERP